MANSLGTLSPVELSLDCLQFLKQKFPILTAVSTDFSAETAHYNQQVISRVVSPISAIDYHTTNGYVADNSTTTDVSVTINKHKHVSVSFNDQDISSTNRNLVNEQVQAAAYSLGLQISNDLWALVTAANFTTTPLNVSSEANVTRANILTLRQKLVVAGATTNRYGIVSAGTFSALGGDVNLFAKLYTDNEPNFQDGVLENVGGFQRIVEFNGLPAGSTPFVRGYFGGKEGLCLTSRVPADPGMLVGDLPIPGSIGNVSDPATGLTVQYRYFYDMQKGKLQMTLTLMYGVSVGVVGHAVLLTTTA